MPILPKADIVLTNGRVFCGFSEHVTEAIALWSGQVLAAGSASEMEPLIGPSTRVIDLAGRLATPGLCDSHMHLLPYGVIMGHVDVRPASAPTLDALLEKVRQRASATPPGQWVQGRGYDQFELDVGRHPLREELDAVAPHHPVAIVRACGHVTICNSMALRLAGIDESTPVPQGGAIEQRDGRLTGLLAETGRDRLKAVLPEPTDEELVQAIDDAGRACLSYGITSVMDAGVGMRAGYREVAAYRTAQRLRRLPVRTTQCLLGGPGGIVEQAYADGVVTGVGDSMLRVGPVKIFTDGSAGGRTAAMTKPYVGEPETTGLMLLHDNEMNDLVHDYHARGYQLAVHAIGDAAIEQTLNAFELALEAMPDPDRRHRIEHAGYARADQNARMKRLGVQPVPQPVFIYDFGDLYVSVVGEERAKPSYPLRTWIDLGFKPAAGSDAPVCDINPFPNFYAMLTRKTSHGTVMDEQEVVSIEQAITAFTEFGAYVNKAEHEWGRLVPGLAGDVAVFSRDLLTASPEEILHDTRCDLTIRGGEVVFDRHGETAR
ncbi:amidohydrolase [Microvirga arsenatis]|uniref:Amidohydrolase family protein n=1 Tax=Microvirga arsenatis TaxID=2692265 RepID=A0ABW9YZY4_9HYPH|nr:amidohydrolase [Microvirga arsenatis]NBJ11124.1 amidohydrolase family protein [Microvirga arsenatis]NBJ25397.1 amidohydrolase family protein [Microvirga arsenatis]